MTIESKQKSTDAIVGFQYAFSNEVSAEVAYAASRVAITLSAGKVWKTIYFTPGSALLSTQVSNPFQGKIVESKFEMKVPGRSAAMSDELERLIGRSVVIKLFYESGEVIVCGGKSRKLRLFYSSITGTQNGYLVVFDYKSKTDFLWLLDESSGSGS